MFIAILKYTLCFGIIMSFICNFFIKRHMNFIWSADGLNQHLITLEYFKNILKSLSLNTFTWNIGFGMDMFSNISYYISGDIFSYISVIIPDHLLKYLYFILVPIRLYFTGITFLCYCKYNNKLTTSSVIGSIIYTFCGFSLIASIRHPYFINAMTVFPLTLIGIEKFINDDKKIFYIFTVFLMFFNSFYFGYMNALVIMVYGIILAIYKYKKDYKKVLLVLIKALLYALIGILMCSMFLLPTIYQFFNSSRSTITSNFYYDINYYRKLLKSIGTYSTSFDNWSIISISPLVLFTLPIFIKTRKKELPLFILILVLILPLLFSTCSFVISGMSYPNNRYIYMLMFIFAYSTTVLDKNIKVDIKKYLIFLIIYLLFIIILDTGKTASFLGTIIIFLSILLAYLYKEKIMIKKKNYFFELISIIIIIGIMFNAYYLYDVYYSNYISEFVENYNVENEYDTVSWTYDNFTPAFDYIKKKDKSFYKISKEGDLLWNLGLKKNYNSINYFYSINSSLYNELSTDLNNRENYVNAEIKEFDNRTKIKSLLGVKYYISNKEENLYGYNLINRIGNTFIYKNNYSTEFASLYTECINTKKYNKLTDLEKEDALLKYYVSDSCNNKNIKLDKVKNIEYESSIKTDKKIKLNVDGKRRFTITPKEKIKGELYLKIDNIRYKDFTIDEKADLLYRNIEKEKYKKENKWYVENSGFEITVSTNSTSKTESVYDENYIYNTNNKDILINLGYYDEFNGNIKIELSKYGIYSFDNMNLYTVSLDDYEENIKNLNKVHFKLDSYDDNYIKGSIKAEEDGVLNFATIYNKGWTVKIDGEVVDTFKNKYFLATNVKKGKHEIELIYKTPYLKEGLIISIISWIIFFTLILWIKIKKVVDK